MTFHFLFVPVSWKRWSRISLHFLVVHIRAGLFMATVFLLYMYAYPRIIWDGACLGRRGRYLGLFIKVHSM